MPGLAVALVPTLGYVFGGFRLDGRLRGLDSGSPTLVQPAPPRNRTSQLPLHGDIVAFP